MRLWSLHPRHLDRVGLVALWREGLLAQSVLAGRTRGYRNHPQLQRFWSHTEPLVAIASYLDAVHREAALRGYRFDRSKVGAAGEAELLEVTTDQLRFEWDHLLKKLRQRAPNEIVAPARSRVPLPHPLFRVVPGPVAGWERVRS